MRKIPKQTQGIAIILIAIVLGSGLFYLVQQDDEEGFLGLASFETSFVPQVTPEPSEPAPEPDNPQVTTKPEVTPAPAAASTEIAPVATDEPSEQPEATSETADPVATDEPTEGTTPTNEPAEGETSALPNSRFAMLQSADDNNGSYPQNGDDAEAAAVTESFPAPLGADVNLLFQWFAFLGLLMGASFAVRKDFTTHRNIMTFWVLMNWFSITGRMTRTVEGYLEAKEPTYTQEFIYLHAALGITVALFASYLVVRMWFENQLPEWFKVKNIKLWMRITVTSWLFLIALGTYMYFDIYAN